MRLCVRVCVCAFKINSQPSVLSNYANSSHREEWKQEWLYQLSTRETIVHDCEIALRRRREFPRDKCCCRCCPSAQWLATPDLTSGLNLFTRTWAIPWAEETPRLLRRCLSTAGPAGFAAWQGPVLHRVSARELRLSESSPVFTHIALRPNAMYVRVLHVCV